MPCLTTVSSQWWTLELDYHIEKGEHQWSSINMTAILNSAGKVIFRLNLQI